MVQNPFPAPGVFRIDIPQMTEDEFLSLCLANPDIPFEREPDGTIIIMSPVGTIGGYYESILFQHLAAWNQLAQQGLLFTSSVGFTLPNRAVRSPDATWIRRDRWQQLPAEKRKGFAQIVPDFVAEIRSDSDSLPLLQAKMNEYIASGVRLGWLIDPIARSASVYRPNNTPLTVGFEATLSGEAVLPGFTFALSELAAELDA